MPASRDELVMTLIFAGALILIAGWVPTRWVAMRLVAVSVLSWLTIGYAWWRLQNLPWSGWSFSTIWPWSFFLLEAIALAYEAWSYIVLTRISDHTPEADSHERRLRAQEPVDMPPVVVFIATYNEPLFIVRKTIRAALGLNYPSGRLRVLVLDDGRRPQLEMTCGRLGVLYIARPPREDPERDEFGLPRQYAGKDGKGGNDQYGFEHVCSEGIPCEFIVLLDADFALRPDFLYRTLGFFERADVGLVQTPQTFRNADFSAHNLGGERAWPEDQIYFMTVTQACRDAWGHNAFCVGTNCIVRRSCLEAMGGFPTSTLCEDLELSYALRLRGYETLFLNERLADGLAPESVPGYIKQRVRWCTGTVQHLFIKTGPIRGPHRPLDRVFYAEGFFYWMGFPYLLLLLVAPLVYWFTGVSAIAGRGDEALRVLAPRLVARTILLYWLSERTITPIVVNVLKTLPSIHLTAALVKALVSPFGKPFEVTDKGERRENVVVRWRLFSVFVGIAAALAVGIAANVSGLVETVPEVTPLDLCWSFYSLLICVLCGLACVELPLRNDGPGMAVDVTRTALVGTLRALATRLLVPDASGMALAKALAAALRGGVDWFLCIDRPERPR